MGRQISAKKTTTNPESALRLPLVQRVGTFKFQPEWVACLNLAPDFTAVPTGCYTWSSSKLLPQRGCGSPTMAFLFLVERLQRQKESRCPLTLIRTRMVRSPTPMNIPMMTTITITLTR